jgi:hypothetical protein
MAHLQAIVVRQLCETYVWTKRFCVDCETFRCIKDCSKRTVRTVFGRVDVKNPGTVKLTGVSNSSKHSVAVFHCIAPGLPEAQTLEKVEPL